MPSTDLRLITAVRGAFGNFDAYLKESLSNVYEEHPLDGEMQTYIDSLESLDDNEFAIFKRVDEIKEKWQLLIEKSVKCLRYYDGREPFLANPAKKPQAYGIEDLRSYYDKYTEFESMLYGGSRYYRDHVIHSFRVWLLGIHILLENNCAYLKKVIIARGYESNPLEKLSVWTIVSLTHDLGYPLEKALHVIEKTRDMMKSFVANPIVSMDLAFNGVQNSMNDYVLRFVSSKMRECDGSIENDVEEEGLEYVARLQPKYYFKFQKSLEHNEHGILSALIIFKLLIYFLESDYSVNEDYRFSKEDSRQFYIRREILRAVASHTCHDIYQLNMFNFSFLLIICDDAQEWGRKSLSELYVNKGETYKFEALEVLFETPPFTCKLKDKYEVEKVASIEKILDSFERQSKSYRKIFRDGQDTNSRNFHFIRQIEIDVTKSTAKNYMLKLFVSSNEQTKIVATKTDNENMSEKEDFYKSFKKIFGKATLSEDSKELSVIL